MTIQMHEIRGSSRVSRYGWEIGAEKTGTLALEFSDGAFWYYAGVPERVFERFLLAPSKGRFFDKEIRPHYRATSWDEAHRRQTGS